jgi:hypothetical protein
MKIILTAAFAISCLAMVSGCSSAPAAPAVVAEAQVAGPPAPAATAQTPATTTVPLTSDLDALTKAARTQGYYPRNHNGTIVFCRTEPQIGTRLQSTSCISQSDVANVVQRSIDNQASVDAMQRKSMLQGAGN